MRFTAVIVGCCMAAWGLGGIAQGAPRQKAARPAANTTSAQAATWAWSVVGPHAGLRGMVWADNGADREVYLTDVLYDTGAVVWRALKLSGSGATTMLTPFFSSPDLGSEIVSLRVAEPAGGLARRLQVGLRDGRQLSYDQASKRLLSTIDGPCTSHGGLIDATEADLNADGLPEQLSVCQDSLLVVHHDAQVDWSIAGVAGDGIVVGQMDDDPALEIATTAGRVIDSGTHQVQWTVPTGLGWRLVMADVDGDGRQELIASDAWYQIRAFDVERQQLKWTASAFGDIPTLTAADLNGDGRPELLYGDGQWGSIHVLDGATGQALSTINNPGWGMSRIAVVDLSGDGVPDILFSSTTDNGQGRNLHLVDGATRVIAWESMGVIGPFIGPKLGDVDGDGVPDIVVATGGSHNARIIVMDSRTLQVKATSPLIGSRWSLYGASALALRDLNGDGRLDVLVATDSTGNGAVEAYAMSPRGKLHRLWQNTSRPAASPFTAVELADVDGDGIPEVLAGNRVASSGSEGLFVYAYDIATGAEKWRQQVAPWGWKTVRGLEVRDLDGDGRPEIVVMLPTVGTRVFDGATRQLLSQLAEDGNVLGRDAGQRLLLAQATGRVVKLAYDAQGLRVKSQRQPVSTSIIGFSDLGRRGFWFGSNRSLWRSDRCCTPAFESLPYGRNMGRETIVLDSGMVITSTDHGLVGFMPP